MAEKVCVATGVGPGTGTALARRFAADGYRVALLAHDAERPDSFFIQPSAIAHAVHHLAHRQKSGWTFELDLRPYSENW